MNSSYVIVVIIRVQRAPLAQVILGSSSRAVVPAATSASAPAASAVDVSVGGASDGSSAHSSVGVLACFGGRVIA